MGAARKPPCCVGDVEQCHQVGRQLRRLWHASVAARPAGRLVRAGQRRGGSKLQGECIWVVSSTDLEEVWEQCGHAEWL